MELIRGIRGGGGLIGEPGDDEEFSPRGLVGMNVNSHPHRPHLLFTTRSFSSPLSFPAPYHSFLTQVLLVAHVLQLVCREPTRSQILSRGQCSTRVTIALWVPRVITTIFMKLKRQIKALMTEEKFGWCTKSTCWMLEGFIREINHRFNLHRRK